ncbi:hypothetical protein [Achromobacter xylosoxidans]|uniref:hypothetical protein n=2 Tax=Alcaligenes xylosoxydans xylosoxydans TaxID=85698 RepID=UPI0011788FE5|nr:hypothetical protein [Achromobacter xylosoxidans]
MRQIKLSVMKGTVQRNGLRAICKAPGFEGVLNVLIPQNKKANLAVGFVCVASFFDLGTPTTISLGLTSSSKGLWWVVLGSNQ